MLKDILFYDKDVAKKNLISGPSAFILGNEVINYEEINHFCFDWDSTLISDEGDILINNIGREYFSQYEWENRTVPHAIGPMFPLLEHVRKNGNIGPILTARTGIEIERVFTTLKSWDLNPYTLTFCAKNEKGPIAKGIGADIFFDDIYRNVQSAHDCGILSAWVPFGVAKE